jgi:hypothetical protein
MRSKDGMAAPLDQAGALPSFQSPIIAEDGAVMGARIHRTIGCLYVHLCTYDSK